MLLKLAFWLSFTVRFGLARIRPLAFVVSAFTTSGVTFVLHGDAIPLVLFGIFLPRAFVVPAGPDGKKTFTRYFGVGDGDAANGM